MVKLEIKTEECINDYMGAKKEKQNLTDHTMGAYIKRAVQRVKHNKVKLNVELLDWRVHEKERKPSK